MGAVAVVIGWRWGRGGVVVSVWVCGVSAGVSVFLSRYYVRIFVG